MDGTDVEVVGQATGGYYGCSLDGKRYGIVVVLDSAGKLGVWEIEKLPAGSVLHDVDGFRAKPIHSWKGSDSANTLRVSFRDHTVHVWVNGEPACDEFSVNQALGPFRVCIAGANGEEPFNCQFDSLRISHRATHRHCLSLPTRGLLGTLQPKRR